MITDTHGGLVPVEGIMEAIDADGTANQMIVITCRRSLPPKPMASPWLGVG